MATKKLRFKIDGMHCTSCSMMIDGDLEDADGVISASTNYMKQVSVVEFDAVKINAEQIVEIIQKTGYKATIDNE